MYTLYIILISGINRDWIDLNWEQSIGGKAIGSYLEDGIVKNSLTVTVNHLDYVVTSHYNIT